MTDGLDGSEVRYGPLRRVRIETTMHRGQPFFVLVDPLQLHPEGGMVVSIAARGVLLALDEARTVAELQRLAAEYDGYALDPAVVLELVRTMEDLYLLEGAKAAGVLDAKRAAFRALPERRPSSAGRAYPDDPEELDALLREYVDEAAAQFGKIAPVTARGVVSPHIDYGRGGPVYAQAWLAAAESLREAELVVVFGTDHAGGPLFTLTRQHYATPFGRLETDRAVVDALAEVIGESAYAAELHHINEHSLELVLVWLHWLRRESPPRVVPILTGSLDPFMVNGQQPHDDATIEGVVRVLREVAAGQKTVFIASGDLAHLGPVFNTDGLDAESRQALAVTDQAFMAQIAAGDAQGMFEFVKAEADARQVCGTAPFYYLLRALGETEGTVLAYAQCPADEVGESWVSIAGAVLG